MEAEALHGNKSQAARVQALDKFRSGRARVLVATDVAARGLVIDGITHVINFELPNEAESYVHRIGRTARAGAEGVALSFCDEGEDPEPRSGHPCPGVAQRPQVGEESLPREAAGALEELADSLHRDRQLAAGAGVV